MHAWGVRDTAHRYENAFNAAAKLHLEGFRANPYWKTLAVLSHVPLYNGLPMNRFLTTHNCSKATSVFKDVP